MPYGGEVLGSSAYAAEQFDAENAGTLILSLESCFNVALGYGGDWYGGLVYAGTPFCPSELGVFDPPAAKSNILDVCVVEC
jgi:hypothetical protein